jgi:hypothetical protein
VGSAEPAGGGTAGAPALRQAAKGPANLQTISLANISPSRIRQGLDRGDVSARRFVLLEPALLTRAPLV